MLLVFGLPRLSRAVRAGSGWLRSSTARCGEVLADAVGITIGLLGAVPSAGVLVPVLARVVVGLPGAYIILRPSWAGAS